MPKMLIKNIKQLLQVGENLSQVVAGNSMAVVPSIEDAFVTVEDEIITGYGAMNELTAETGFDCVIDAKGKTVMPSFCDAHTHLVYAGSRETEFVDRIKGLSYEEIAQRGGGILNSAKLLHNTSEEELYQQALVRVNDIMAHGTGAVEIKSGYGLNTDDELKMLRVIKRLKETTPLTIKATFLGAHALPLAYRDKRHEYIDMIMNEMIPVIASEELADFIDVFCEKGFFDTYETETILMAGLKHGLKPKVHANQLSLSGGIEAGVKYAAQSVDHLEFVGAAQIEILKQSDTMPVLLPGASFFLHSRYAQARQLIDAGLPVALASDYNPGTSPSGNMQLVMSLACIKLRMLPEEALNAVTINGAYAMAVDDSLGSIACGKTANLIITKPIQSLSYIPYSFGSNSIETVILHGKVQKL